MTTFALVGAAGFVAPRHMEAIRAVGGKLVAALDPRDSVGILDRYNKDVQFFTEPERFERYLYKHRGEIDFLSVCSPNYLHVAHIHMGLRNGCNVICEKPLVLNPENLEGLIEAERESGKRVNVVLQLRENGYVRELKQVLGMRHQHHQIVVDYSTPRGPWYHQSWKGDPEKSGGLMTNIGIHLFDVLIHLFGEPLFEEGAEVVHQSSPEVVRGTLTLPQADVTWRLSIKAHGVAQRLLEIDGTSVALDEGFATAHTVVYEQILAGKGWGIADAAPAVAFCHRHRLRV